MRQSNTIHLMLWNVFILAVPSLASGEVLEFNNQVAWENAAGDFTTITFTEIRGPVNLSSQYAGLGVVFTEGNDALISQNSFVNDQWGVYGNANTITIAFDQPQAWIGVDHPGFASFKLYGSGQFFNDTGAMLGGGEGLFSGVVSDQQFDEVVIYDPFGGVFIDDLHWGAPVPAPGALVLLGMVGLWARRRRRA